MVESFDTIVIGGGHNGLTAAAYLAREGQKVLVLESRSTVGGFCTSLDNVAEAPGFIMNPYAADHVLTNIPPTVDDELNLAAEGLRWAHPDPFYSYLDPDGGSIVFWRDVKRTVNDIRRFSPRDAAQYEKFNEIMTDLWQTAYPYLQGHPTRLRPMALAHMLQSALRRRGNLSVAARILLGSPAAAIDEWFESPQLRSALACFAVSTMAPLDEPGSGIILAMMAIQHKWGVRRPIGGNQSFVEAIASKIRRHGGIVQTDSPVAAIDTKAGAVTGVTVVSGKQYASQSVVCTVDPWTMCNRLLPADVLPEATHREIRGMSVLRNNISAFKIDIAVSRKPNLARHARTDADLLNTVMLLAPSVDYVKQSTATSLRGHLPEEVPMWVAVPSNTDRSLVPAGSIGDTIYVFMPAIAADLKGMRWADGEGKLVDRCLSAIEEYMPGLNDSIIGTHITNPDDLAEESGIHKGHIFHVDMSLSQFGPWRPTPSLSGYKTPIKGLLHSGGGNHPMGTLSGWSGRTVAREVSRKSRKIR